MNAQMTSSLIESASLQIEQSLKDGQYHLEHKSRPYLANGKKMVVCILNEEVGEQKETLRNIKLAQEFYQELPPQLKRLAELKPSPADSPQPTAKARIAAQKEKALPIVLGKYFSGYTESFDRFKQENKDLCNFMRKQEVLGQTDQPEHSKSMCRCNLFFEHHLYKMFMVEQSRASLSDLITEFHSTSDIKTRTEVAIKIAKQCLQRSEATSRHLYSNRESYNHACQAKEADHVDHRSSTTIHTKPFSAQPFREAVKILQEHLKEAAGTGHFLNKTYNSPDFAFQLDMKKAESDDRYYRQGGPAQAKTTVLAEFQAMIEGGEIIDVKSGDLKVPAVVATHREDMECFKTYAGVMLTQYKKLASSRASRDSASFQDTDFLLNICQVSLQTMDLIDSCSKKVLQASTENLA